MFHLLIGAIFNLAADRDPRRRAHCGLEGFRQRGEVEAFGNWNDGYVVRYAAFFSLLSFRGIFCLTLHFALHFYFVCRSGQIERCWTDHGWSSRHRVLGCSLQGIEYVCIFHLMYLTMYFPHSVASMDIWIITSCSRNLSCDGGYTSPVG